MAALPVTGPLPSEKQLKHTLKNLKYSQYALTAKHIMVATEAFHKLRPSIKEYVHIGSGRRADLMQLSGTIHVKSIDQGLHVPVRVWLEKGYPKVMPMININPAGDMALVSVDYIDKEGKVNLHYITEWTEEKELCTLLQLLQTKFNQQCPIHAIKLRSGSGRFTLPRYNRSENSLAIRSSYQEITPHSLSRKSTPIQPVGIKCGHEKELTRMQSKIDKQETEIESLTNNLEGSNGKVEYYRNQVKETEEKLKAQKVLKRGSFSTGVFDALMQHDVWREKKEKEDQKERMGKMVTELTESRERIGILQADKEEYQERLVMLTVEYQRVKHEYCRLVKERNLLHQELAVTRSELNLATHQLSLQKDEGQSIEESSSDSEEEHESDNFDANNPGGDNTMAEQRQEAETEYHQETNNGVSELEPSTPAYLPSEVLEKNENLTDSNPSLSQLKTETQLTSIAEVSKQEGDETTKAAQQTTEQDKMETNFESLKKEKQELEERLQELREGNKAQELENKDLKKKLSEIQQHDSSSSHKESEDTEQLKRLLDDAMRKIRKYDVYTDKEEQLEKQKQFLQTQLNRTLADHAELDSKLKKEKWKVQQELKEAVSRTQQLEREIQALQKRSVSSDYSITGEGASQLDCEGTLFSEEEGQSKADDAEISCVINHLDRLLSK